MNSSFKGKVNEFLWERSATPDILVCCGNSSNLPPNPPFPQRKVEAIFVPSFLYIFFPLIITTRQSRIPPLNGGMIKPTRAYVTFVGLEELRGVEPPSICDLGWNMRGRRLINTRRWDVGALRAAEAERSLGDGGGMRGRWRCHLSVMAPPALLRGPRLKSGVTPRLIARHECLCLCSSNSREARGRTLGRKEKNTSSP